VTKPFLEINEVPEGFDPTMELAWIETIVPIAHSIDSSDANCAEVILVLCQKYIGAFRDCWVRIPIR
jgi:hypothetical protein